MNLEKSFYLIIRNNAKKSTKETTRKAGYFKLFLAF